MYANEMRDTYEVMAVWKCTVMVLMEAIALLVYT